MRVLFFLLLSLALVHFSTYSQVQFFPFSENFDRVTVPSLPQYWATSTNRLASGDFITTTSSPFSDSNCVISTNSTIPQSLTTPEFDFSNKLADSIIFYERRSGSHTSGVILEASTNSGTTFTVQIIDTIKNPGTTAYVARRFKLPSTLDNQQHITFRWRVIGNGTGTTGTIRFDNITISAKFQYDLGISRLIFSPEFPNTGESVTIFTTIQNDGTLPVQDYSLELYKDADNDSLPDENELFTSSHIVQLLQPGDTVRSMSMLNNLSFGEQRIITKIILAEDQNPINDTRHSNLSVGLTRYSVIVNEIMYAPHTGEPEWIEIFNTTSNPVDMKNWKLGNRNSSSKYLIASGSSLIPPKSYLIITKDTTLFHTIYENFTSAILQSSSLPTSLFNNSGDAVVLYDARGGWQDSVRYSSSWGGTGGKTLERIEANASSSDSMNWSTSGDTAGSTPGIQNYNTPLEFDLRALRLFVVDSNMVQTTIALAIKNAGHQPAQSFTVSLFYDSNEDSLPQQTELIQTQTVSVPLIAKDSVTINFTWQTPPAGKKLLIGTIDFPQDMRTSDNIVFGSIKNSFDLQSIVINEIMYDPLPGYPEYIELYNRSNTTVNLQDWNIYDSRDTSTRSTAHRVSSSPMHIGAGGFIVIANDSSLFEQYPYLMDSSYHVVVKKSAFGLSNSGDDILLTDLTGKAIDSLHYFPTWHNADIDEPSGRSLERINPNILSDDKRNWSTSASSMGGTPGMKNSLLTISIPSSAAISFAPNPFSPDGDGFEDVTMLNYSVATTTALIRVRIYDVNGRMIQTLADGEPSGSRGEIIWDGYNDNHEKVRMGIYVVLLEALDGNGGNIQAVKGVVVVAAKM